MHTGAGNLQKYYFTYRWFSSWRISFPGQFISQHLPIPAPTPISVYIIHSVNNWNKPCLDDHPCRPRHRGSPLGCQSPPHFSSPSSSLCHQQVDVATQTHWYYHLKKQDGQAIWYEPLQSQGQGQVKNGLPCSTFNTYCLFSCQEHVALLFCLCWPTVTLHQGQGHQNEHEHIYIIHKSIMPSLNVILK